MQLLCLTHGAHLTADTANQIALFLGCDIRAVFNCLQVWLSYLEHNDNTTSSATPRHGYRSPLTPFGSSEASRLSSTHVVPSPVCLDHLLGSSSFDQAHGFTSDMLEKVHLAGLEVSYPIGTLAPNFKSMSAERPNSVCPESSSYSHLRTPWTSTPAAGKKNLSCKYHLLDSMSNLCDDFSYMDIVTRRSCDSHMTTTRLPDHTPWWHCRPQTELSEELSNSSQCDVAMGLSQGMAAVMEALVRERVWREMGERGSESSKDCGEHGDVYGLVERLERKRSVCPSV